MAAKYWEVQELREQWNAALQSYRQLQFDMRDIKERMLRTEERVDGLWKAMGAVEYRLGMRIDFSPQPVQVEAPKPKNRPSAAARRRRRAREEFAREAESGPATVSMPDMVAAANDPPAPAKKSIKVIAKWARRTSPSRTIPDMTIKDLMEDATPRCLSAPIYTPPCQPVRFLPMGYEFVEATCRTGGQLSCPGSNLEDLCHALPIVHRGAVGRGVTIEPEVINRSRDARCKACHLFHERNECSKTSAPFPK